MASLAKLMRPNVFGALARDRLFAYLDELVAASAVWIEGPPGAGKTTLASTYLNARSSPTLWYQVDAGDSDPASFFHYLGIAASTLNPAATLPATFAPEHLSDVPGFAKRYFRELFAALGDGATLVFDNIETLLADAVTLAALQELLAERPSESRVIVISRGAPPSAFARARLSGLLMVLGWDVLRLTKDETAHIAAGHINGEIWSAERLHEASGGWAAGVRLLLDYGGMREGASMCTREALFGYFAAEVFDRMPPDEQRVLLATAYLPFIPVDAARYLSECANAGDILFDLQRRNLFTDVRRGEPPIYVYHGLLREFLQARVRRTSVASEKALISRTALHIAQIAGMEEVAFDLSCRGEEWACATRIIVAHSPRLLGQGRLQTLKVWIDALPPDAVEAAPWVRYWRGVVGIHLAAGEVLGDFEAAFACFDALGDAMGKVAVASAAVDAVYFAFSNFENLQKWAARLQALLDDPSIQITADMDLAASTSMLTAAHHWSGFDVQLEACFARVERLLAIARDPNARVRAATALLISMEYRGQARNLRRIAAVVEAPLSDPMVAPMVRLQYLARRGVVGGLYFGEREPRQISEAIATIEKEGFATFLPIFLMADMLVRLQLNDAPGLRALLERLEKTGGERAAPCWHAGMRAGLALLEQRAMDALEWMERCRALVEDERSWNYVIATKMFSAHAFCLAGDYERAIEYAEATGRLFSDRAIIGGGYDPALPKSFALIKLGRFAEAEAILRHALASWPSEGYTSAVIWAPWFIGPLFEFALQRNIESEYLSWLIRYRDLPAPSQECEFWPRAADIRLLGGFSISIRGEQLRASRKTPKRLLALLTAIVAFGGDGVSDESLCDAVWADKDGDVARDLLATGLHRLRKLIGDPAAVRLHGGRVSLDRQRVWVDALNFERLADRSLSGRADASAALRLYTGAFAADGDTSAIAQAARIRLCAKYVRLVIQHCAELERAGARDAALQIAMRAVELEPHQQELVHALARRLNDMGRIEEADALRLRHESKRA